MTRLKPLKCCMTNKKLSLVASLLHLVQRLKTKVSKGHPNPSKANATFCDFFSLIFFSLNMLQNISYWLEVM